MKVGAVIIIAIHIVEEISHRNRCDIIEQLHGKIANSSTYAYDRAGTGTNGNYYNEESNEKPRSSTP